MPDRRSRGPTTGPIGTTDMIARQTGTEAIEGLEPVGGLVADLAVSPDTGTRAYVTDATAPTFLAVVVGGGAAFVPVIFDGSDWVVG